MDTCNTRWPTYWLTGGDEVCACVCVCVGDARAGCSLLSFDTNRHTEVNQFSRQSEFIYHLPFRGIVFDSNLNSGLNLSHDLKIMHSTWHQISSIASSTTCRWAIAVEICQNRHFGNVLFNFSAFRPWRVSYVCSPSTTTTYLPYPMHSICDIALNNAHEYCSSQ